MYFVDNVILSFFSSLESNQDIILSFAYIFQLRPQLKRNKIMGVK